MANEEKPRATENEIEAILNHYGKNKDFLKECWKVCAKNNLILPYKLYFDLDDEYYTKSDSCKELKKDGVKWKWLPSDILQILPTMAAPYMDIDLSKDIPPIENTDLENEENVVLTEEDLNADITSKVPDLSENNGESNDSIALDTTSDNKGKEENILPTTLWEEEIIDKINNEISLTEDELKELIFDGYSIHTEEGENRRWSRTMTDIIKLTDRYSNDYFYSLDWEEGLTEMQENEFYNQPERVYPYEKVTINKQELFTNDKLVAEQFNDKLVNLDFVRGILTDKGLSLDDRGNLIMDKDNKKQNIKDIDSDDFHAWELEVADEEIEAEADDDFDLDL